VYWLQAQKLPGKRGFVNQEQHQLSGEALDGQEVGVVRLQAASPWQLIASAVVAYCLLGTAFLLMNMFKNGRTL
jgi:hypothetical protein